MKHLLNVRTSILMVVLKGTITVTAGLGGMGGAQPLAVTMAGGVVLELMLIEHVLKNELKQAIVIVVSESVDDAIALAEEAKGGKSAFNWLVGNAAEMLPEMIRTRIYSRYCNGSNIRT